MLSKRSQVQHITYLYDSIYVKFDNRKIYRDRKQTSAYQELLEGDNRKQLLMGTGLLGRMMKMFPKLMMVVVIQLHELIKSH